MCLFSRLFQNIRYRHVFSLQIKGNHRVHPHFPSPCERISVPKSIQCDSNSLRYFGNTDRVHLACKQKSAGCRCRCAHVSVKSKEIQLASIRPWIDGHSGI